MPSPKIQATKNYALFSRSAQNRDTDIKRHKGLMRSMQKYGFLPCFPIVCTRDKNGGMEVKEGQHRLAIAQSLGIQVWYVVVDTDFDVAEINNTAKGWKLRDYAEVHARNGVAAYEDGLRFADEYKLTIGTAFSLLAGTTCRRQYMPSFIAGTFKVKDRTWAASVAGIYAPLLGMAKCLRTARFVEACMAVCRVKGFDQKRLIGGAERCREKLVAYSTRDAYLDMLEQLYNFGRRELVPLKTLALTAMRDRSSVAKKKAAKQHREQQFRQAGA